MLFGIVVPCAMFHILVLIVPGLLMIWTVQGSVLARAIFRRIVFIAPSRGMIGYQGEFLTDTRGTGVMSRLFHSYAAYKGPIGGRRNGIYVNVLGKSGCRTSF